MGPADRPTAARETLDQVDGLDCGVVAGVVVPDPLRAGAEGRVVEHLTHR
jgi:hypothetical protein